jgi:septal ring factor EnvC (AmiA/AmiB activator)
MLHARRLADLSVTALCIAMIGTSNAVSQEQNADCGAQAVLQQPAEGRVLVAFGGGSKGIVLETQHGADVRAPVTGTVVYAGEFRSYGKLVTIAIGCATHVMIAGLGNIAASLGERIGAGQTLGTASQGQGEPLPVVYLEVRRNGQPIDPGLLSPGK